MAFVFPLIKKTRRRNMQSLFCHMWVTFFYYAFLNVGFGNSNVIHIFEDHNNSTPMFNHFDIDKNTGQIFIGAVNRLYQLTSDLNVMNNVITGPIKDSFECHPTYCPKNITKYLTDNVNKVLVIDYNTSRIITCGSVLQGMCTVRNLNNISVIVLNVNKTIVANTVNASTVAFIAPGPPNPPETQVMYIGVTFTNNSPYRHYIPAVASRSLNSQRMLNIAHEEYSSGTYIFLDSKIRPDFPISYVYGFSSGSYSYFLTTQMRNTNVPSLYVSKIIRLCHADKLYYSYAEIPLECTSKERSYNLVQAAYVSKIGSDLAKDLGIESQDDVLFAVFSDGDQSTRELSRKSNDRSALCIYSLKAITDAFLHDIKKCFSGNGYRGSEHIIRNTQCVIAPLKTTDEFCGLNENTPLGGETGITAIPALTFNIRLTAVTATPTGNFTVVFVGTRNGHVEKIVVESSVKAIKYGDIMIQENCPINSDLKVDPRQTHFYVMTKNRISMVKIHECHLYNSCLDCLAANDPYCGWCLSVSKCLSHSNCSNNTTNDSLNWIPYKSNKCPVVISVTPNQLQQTTSQTLEIKISYFSLLEEPFFCEFSLFNNAFITKATRTSLGVNCSTPQTDLLSVIQPNKHNFTTKLTVKTAKSPNLVNTYFTFFDCSTYTSCTQCVTSLFSCDWCVVAHKCTHDMEKNCLNDIIITGVNHNDSSRRGEPLYCPSINGLDIESKEILIPSGFKKSIEVKAHIIDKLMTRSQFVCKFSIEGHVLSANATLLNDTILCDTMDFSYHSNFPNITVTFDIIWGESKPIDNPFDIRIILYKCRYLADGCGMCLTLPKKYGCGWFTNGNICEIMDRYNQKSDTLLYRNETCPDLQITSFWPQTGPWEGHTNITIIGRNLGKNINDIYNGVTVAGIRCIPYVQLYEKTKKIVCRVNGTGDKVMKEGPIVVQVGIFRSESQSKYRFVDPVITGLYPGYGPKSGGTILTIQGKFMNAGSNIQVFFEDKLPCIVINSTSTETLCITSASDVKNIRNIKMFFDNSERNFNGQTFQYTADPKIESVESDIPGRVMVPKGIASGGVNVSFNGKNFAFIQNPRLYVYYMNDAYYGDCFNLNDSNLICESPEITPLKENQPDSEKPLQLDYGFKMDNVTDVQNVSMKNGFSKYLIFPDPEFDKFEGNIKIFNSEYLVINGNNLNQAFREADVTVQIGTSYCNVTSLSNNQLICKPPSNQPPAKSDNYELSNSTELPDVIVLVGSRFKVNIGKLKYKLYNYIPVNKKILFCICMGLIIIFVGIIIKYQRKFIESKRDLKNMRKNMDTLELNVASECKNAFAELQTEMIDINSDLISSGIPFLDYRTYSLKMLFPNIIEYQILKRENLESVQNEKGIRFFRQLVLNKTFLLLFIKTLECNQCFSMNDKVKVASLIMISLQSEMEYCTNILKILLSDIIKKLMNGHSHPKLFLRSSESVAEKMLSYWFTFLLYKFLKECAGEPLYLLFRAIQQQIDEGPVDNITSEAKYSLREDMLITQSIDFRPMIVYVSIYQQTSPITGLNLNIENIPVKVLDCDTVSQVKEKSLDTIFRTMPFSQRPPTSEFDVMWKTSPSCQLVLYDDDCTSIVEGVWKKCNTLHHYKVPNGAYLILVSVKQTSNYNLSILSNKINDIETLNLSKCNYESEPLIKVTSQLNVNQNDVHKYWHLVKHFNHEGRKEEEKYDIKMVSEIYLPRLLTTKNTVQNYVNDLFETILSITHRSSSLPLAIKYMFDFLDNQAIQHGITDHEVAYSWKTNSLPLRFWVTLIKNPNFIFDVHKSNIVDSCLSVVAQTFMDSYSTSDYQLKKDSPSSKLLFAKDIPIYKNWAKRYFRSIQNMTAVSDQDMNALLAEESRIHKTEFNANYALYELYGYVAKYSKQLMSTLEKDEFSQKQQLSYKLKRLHSLMIVEK